MSATRKKLTLCLFKTDTHILLGMKKRGFGEGLWNGFGGKVESDETIEEATIREVKEEIGVCVTKLESVGQLTFTFEETGEVLEVHLFEAIDWVGEVIETEEMKPEWFLHSEIPYDTMWPDDIFWIPYFLEGKKFTGSFSFDSNNKIVKNSLDIERE